MAWFEINGNHIVSHDYNPWSEYNGGVWGNIKTHKDFYAFCEWLGVYYKKDGVIYKHGEKYDEQGKKL